MFTLIAVLTLAIGIGANTAVFSVIDGVLLKPLPYPKPSELILLDHKAPGVKMDRVGMAPFLYYIYREQGRSFEDVGEWTTETVTITGLAEPENVTTLDLTDGVLPLLRVKPAMGRVFSRADDAADSPRTMMLSYAYWKTRLGGDPSAIGQRIVVDGNAVEVIGILPEKFKLLDIRAEVAMPMRKDRNKVVLGQFSYQALARLKPGVTQQQASADMMRLIPVALDAFPPFPGFNRQMFVEAKLAPLVMPLKDRMVGDLSGVLWVLMGTIGIVLLIACANVANLLLVRADGRRQELAIRAALGASWARIARELMTESVALGLLGGLSGLALAYGALRLLTALAPGNLPRIDEISIDGRALLFTFAVSLFAGLLFGAIPVVKYAGPQLATGLRGGGRTLSQSKERHRARNMLVIVQVALAMVLLIGSGLMIRTFLTMRHIDPGFANPQQVEALHIAIPYSQEKDAVRVARIEQQIMDKIAAVPGVTSVAATSIVPMTGTGWTDGLFVQDQPYSESQIPPLRRYKMISPGWSKTMQTPIVAGREFTWEDVFEKRNVAMVSENLARELWGQPSAAIGKRVRENLKGEWREVVGVVGDVRDDGVSEKAPTVVMWPFLMGRFGDEDTFVSRGMAYLVRGPRTGSTGFLNEITRAVWSVNANLPVANVRSLQEIYENSLARTSFTLVMLAIAGVMALLLGVVGIYGVISYSVAQRTREIGIRIALGAQKDELTRMFVIQGLKLAAIGVAFGLAAAVGLTRAMRSLLFEVQPVDPITYAAVAAGLTLAAAFASYLPAMRAASVDPTDALRAD
jgi:predicted permease